MRFRLLGRALCLSLFAFALIGLFHSQSALASDSNHTTKDSVRSGLSDGDWIALGGDILVVVGFAVAYVIYRDQQFDAANVQLDATLNVLTAVRDGMKEWGDLYFQSSYSQDDADKRAMRDYSDVLKGGVPQVFRVPPDPIENLVRQPGEGWLIDQEVIERANFALWKIGVFNQFVQLQTDFSALHCTDVLSQSTDPNTRDTIALGYKWICRIMHSQGIGDAGWYPLLMNAINMNIDHLKAQKRAHWWNKSQIQSAAGLSR